MNASRHCKLKRCLPGMGLLQRVLSYWWYGTHCVLDPSDGVFGRFDLAALGDCHTLNVCYVMLCYVMLTVYILSGGSTRHWIYNVSNDPSHHEQS